MLTVTVATTFHVLPSKRGVKLTRSAAGLERTTAINSVFVHVVEASPPTERESAGQGEVGGKQYLPHNTETVLPGTCLSWICGKEYFYLFVFVHGITQRQNMPITI